MVWTIVACTFPVRGHTAGHFGDKVCQQVIGGWAINGFWEDQLSGGMPLVWEDYQNWLLLFFVVISSYNISTSRLIEVLWDYTGVLDLPRERGSLYRLLVIQQWKV